MRVPVARSEAHSESHTGFAISASVGRVSIRVCPQSGLTLNRTT
jgi:hypothetical protein